MELISQNKNIPKSLTDLCILDILMDTSERKPVTQKEIRIELDRRYGIGVDRKTVHRRLQLMTESVEGLHFKETARMVEGDESAAMTDFWLDNGNELDETELMAISYIIACAKHIPARIKKDLIDKVATLSDKDMRLRLTKYLAVEEPSTDDSMELFWTMKVLDEAIEEKKRVSFQYAAYTVEKKLEVSERHFTVSPLEIGVRDDNFYLIALINGEENVAIDDMVDQLESVIGAMKAGEVRVDIFRLDRIRNIEKLEEDRETLDDPKALHLEGAEWDQLNVLGYLKENPSLTSGHTVKAELRLTEGPYCSLSDVIDHFGTKNVRIKEETKPDRTHRGVYTVRASANNGDLRDFALRYTGNVEILKPATLRSELRELYEAAIKQMQVE